MIRCPILPTRIDSGPGGHGRRGGENLNAAVEATFWPNASTASSPRSSHRIELDDRIHIILDKVADRRLRRRRGPSVLAALRRPSHAEARQLAQSRRDRSQPVVTPMYGPRSNRDPLRAQVPHAPLEQVRRPRAQEDQIGDSRRPRRTGSGTRVSAATTRFSSGQRWLTIAGH